MIRFRGFGMTYKTLSLLILAENALFAEALAAQLQDSSGFAVKLMSFADLPKQSAEAFSGLDLVLLVGAPAPDIEKMLRSNLYRGPVLQLARAEEGSDAPDIMRLPVRMAALFQKIRSLAASFWFRDDLVIEIGALRLRPAFKELMRKGEEPIALTDKEVEILLYLYRAGGKIISRDVLLAEIWGYNAQVSTHTLETHIYRLRQKIETDPEIGSVLITEQGGYRLAAG
jgi:DNA-binding response OmpR family regulator